MSNWYVTTRQALQSRFGDNWRLFAGLLAATSPNCQLKSNWTLALKAYTYWLHTGGVPRSGFTATHYNSIQAVLSGKAPNGRKCAAFYHCLIGIEGAIPVDIWIMRAYKLSGKAPTKRQYDTIEADIFRKAAAAKVQPSAYQAALWAKVRRNGTSYADYAAQLPLDM